MSITDITSFCGKKFIVVFWFVVSMIFLESSSMYWGWQICT